MTEEQFIFLKKQIKEDVTITDENVVQKSGDVPFIYQKYLDLFITELKSFKIIKNRKERLYANLYHHLKFDVNFKLDSKSEIETSIHGEYEPEDDKDTKGILLRDKQNEYDEVLRQFNWGSIVVKYLEDALKNVSNMSFNISNYLKLKQFFNGGEK